MSGKLPEAGLLASISAAKSGRSIRELGSAYKIADSTCRNLTKAGITITAGLGRKATFAGDPEQELAEYGLRLA
jgi:hypothetical protein